MSVQKYPLDEDVLQVATGHCHWAFNNLSRLCVSFSGGKDSGVMLHLVVQEVRRLNIRVHVLFIDWKVVAQPHHLVC